MKHHGYNNVINGADHPYGFQEQEEQNELGLNWIGFKWRNHDPAIGRFFNIDPLAEKYKFNSPYAFSENRVISGRELEGLEHAFYSYNGSAQSQINKASEQVTKEDKVQAASMQMDALPGIGDVKGFIEAFTGTDLVTGETLSTGSRLLGLVFLSELRTIGKVADAVKTGTKGGERAGKDFTPKGKQEVIDANKQKNSGQTVCENCGTDTVPAKKSKKGETPPGNETQVDHIYPKSKGGDGDPSNGQVLCRDCNRAKGNKTPDEQD